MDKKERAKQKGNKEADDLESHDGGQWPILNGKNERHQKWVLEMLDYLVTGKQDTVGRTHDQLMP